MIDSKALRRTFIEFFVERGHHPVSASPVVPQNDPTLLFTNAGMNQFKDVFLGQGTREYSRAVNSQVCIRVSGKHNDLEDVGLDTTHLTSFEMLGNWSFGDYYKEDAIKWAWALFTKVLKLPEEKIYVTIYKTDHESGQLWEKLTTINPHHILPFGDKDNFWEMGESGPCGPCSELHLDRGPDACDKKGTPHTCEVNGECNRYVELWNLVFIQYNRNSEGDLTDLPHKHVDTGAGLERLLAYLQGTTSNYNTDLFIPIIQRIATLSGVPYDEGPEGMPHRVLSDHIRTLVFSISDNVRPSNEGRGYVLRRLLRRALRYAAKLGIHDPVLHKLVAPVIETLGDHFTHLKERESFIKEIILSEEVLFLKTLSHGLKLFSQISNKLKNNIISGEDAFKLYDTFGFPIDLTQVMAKERGLLVDMDGFESQLEIQRNRSRLAQKKYSNEISVSQDNRKVDPKIQEQSEKLLAPLNAKAVAMGGEARIVTHPLDRVGMARHHTATHLLHAALRKHLGEHVQQAGSLVEVDHLRFDFLHFEPIKTDLIAIIESEINQQIQDSIPISTLELPLEEAKLLGAIALFGEKYDDTVRMVQIGNFSKELCIGTHVPNTGIIEQFKIIHESAIAAGTRRIEAIAGHKNIQNEEEKKQTEWILKIEKINSKLESRKSPLKENWKITPPSQWNEVEFQLTQAVKSAEKERLAIQNQEATHIAHSLNNSIILTSQGKFIITQTLNMNINLLRTVVDQIIHLNPDISACIASIWEEKVNIVTKQGPLAKTNLSSEALIKEAILILGGRGGGKKSHAQSGGGNPKMLEQALSHLKKWVTQEQ